MATKKSKDERKREEYKPRVPKRLFAIASPHSIGGVSMFDMAEQISAGTVANFFSEKQLIYRAVDMLKQAGFEVLQISDVGINIAGSLKTYEKAFDTEILPEERPVIKAGAVEDTATFWESADTEMLGLISTEATAFGDVLEGVAMEEPRYYMAPSMFPPTKEYWHLRMPGDVSLGCNADRAHRTGITGRGVKVAMVDSGWYKHPFFVGRGYRAAPVVLGPGAANPLKDESGHGTGESANVFAVAPDVQLLPVKLSFVNTVAAFNTAVGLGPDIITCSWGSSRKTSLSAADQMLAAAVGAAVAGGIVVVFSAGNGHWGFPGQHPDVISAGGVYMEVDGSLQASDYASGFMSNIYPNRRVPDLCGLVGMRPKAIYIMLPVEPNDTIDSLPWNHPSGQGIQGGKHPDGDETDNDDGWAAFSGTSAAAPQLAGAAALIKQACARLNPRAVRDILMKGARDVTAGRCHPNTGQNQPPNTGNPATPGPDTATGNGLVDAHKAVLLAKVRCLGPTRALPGPQPRAGIRRPIEPIEPIRRPVEPIEPIRRPVGPIEPIRRPIEPIEPIRRPIEPVPPRFEQVAEETVELPPAGLAEEDVEALEDMILSSEMDLGDLET